MTQWKLAAAALCAGAFVACGAGVDNGPQTCDYHGVTYKDGASFLADDGCNTCRCMADGSLACTEKACVSCESITSLYGALMEQAKACDPDRPNQCSERVVEGLICGCETHVNPQAWDPAAAQSLKEGYTAAACGAGIVCGPCAVPTGAHCSAEGTCVDTYEVEEGPACKVGRVVYPHGASNIPDPTSCNKCQCDRGLLTCTEKACPVPCPADTEPATSCAQCGPTDVCLVVEHGCFPTCTDACDSGFCNGGVCVSLCG